jgi:HSP20 family molecular chaperone IbpA
MSSATTETTVEKRPETEVTRAERTRSGRFYRPNVDIVEKDDELMLMADLPGTCADSIDINFENGVLTLHGRVCERQDENTNYLWREYGLGDFYRTFQVSEEIDSSRITAEYRDGVLMLHLPKSEHARARKISVKAS